MIRYKIIYDKPRKIYNVDVYPIYNLDTESFGGYIQGEHNLIQNSNAWIHQNAIVMGDVVVGDNAQIYGQAMISGRGKIMGDTVIKGNIHINTMNANKSIHIVNNSILSGDILIDGDLICNDSLLINGNFILLGKLKSNNALTINGCITILADVNILAKSHLLDNIIITENTLIYGTHKLHMNINYYTIQEQLQQLILSETNKINFNNRRNV